MSEIKNLSKTKDRILKAIKKNEKIILYGDSDLDGATSLIVLKEAINNLGGNIVDIHFPDRQIEGYGLTNESLEYFKKYVPALLIILDMGISSFDEVDLANQMGFEVIIIDHHKILDRMPKAFIVVDPKQEGDEYPFKEFANVGIIYKLVEILLEDKMTSNLREDFLGLTALGTVADMMIQEEDNEFFVKNGLILLENSHRPGIKLFLKREEFEDLDLNEKVSKLISVLNIREIEDGRPASYRFLTAGAIEAEKMIDHLIEKNIERKETIGRIVEEIEDRIIDNQDPIIFEGSKDWDLMVISLTASILCKRHQKPVFVYKQLDEVSQGTVRSIKDIDSVSLMDKCKDLLITYGGHPPASGFRIKNENLEKFKERLINQLN